MYGLTRWFIAQFASLSTRLNQTRTSTPLSHSTDARDAVCVNRFRFFYLRLRDKAFAEVR